MDTLIKWTIAVSASVLVTASALSDPIPVNRDFVDLDGNPTACPGFFSTNSGFDSCNIFIGDGEDKVLLSPVIAKYEYDEGTQTGFETNTTEYPSFDGSEIEISFDDKDSGTWNYTPNDPADPGIKYWAAFGGAGFTLSWYVDPADEGVCAGDAYNLACLQQALVVESGEWSNPSNPAGQAADLSNLVFFNTGINDIPVPEPGTAALLFSGLMGLFMARRRQRSLQA